MADLKPVIYPAKAKKFKDFKAADFEGMKKAIAAKIGYEPDVKDAVDAYKTIEKNANLRSVVNDGLCSCGVAGTDLIFRVEQKKLIGDSYVVDTVVAKRYPEQERKKGDNEKVAQWKKYKEWWKKIEKFETFIESLDEEDLVADLIAPMKKALASENLEFCVDVCKAKNAADYKNVYETWLKPAPAPAKDKVAKLGEVGGERVNVTSPQLKEIRTLAAAGKFGDAKFKETLKTCARTLYQLMNANATTKLPVAEWKKRGEQYEAKLKEWAKLND